LDSQHGQAKDDQRDPSAGTSVLEERHRANQQGGLEPESQGGSIPEPETDLGGIIEQREIGAMDDQIEDPMGEDGGGDEYTRAAFEDRPRRRYVAAAATDQRSAATRLCV